MFICLLGASLPLFSGGNTTGDFRLALLGTIPFSDLKDRGASTGIGASVAWRCWQMSESSSVQLLLEHRIYSTKPGQASLTDAGFDIQSRIHGGFYSRIGLTAERIDLTGMPGTTRLGGIFGFGFRGRSAFGVEIYEFHSASSTPSINTLNVALTWSF